jgi:hypothetical protein
MEGRSFQGLDREMNKNNLMGIGGLLLGMAMALHSSEIDFPKLAGPYLGQKPPGMTPKVFAPGIVSSAESREFSGAFTPDGKEYYFFRFADGAGMMATKLTSDGWTKPRPASFDTEHIDNEPAILAWRSTVKNITYVFGWDARKGERTVDLPAPRATKTLEGMEIFTVNCEQDDVPEVAYLVKKVVFPIPVLILKGGPRASAFSRFVRRRSGRLCRFRGPWDPLCLRTRRRPRNPRSSVQRWAR